MDTRCIQASICQCLLHRGKLSIEARDDKEGLLTTSLISPTSCYRDRILQSVGDTSSPTIQYMCGGATTGATLYRTWSTG